MKWLVNTSINGVISEHVSIDGDDNSKVSGSGNTVVSLATSSFNSYL